MSNRKRNVAFTKPQDPSFLQKIKEQIGYKEGPNVDTKRQKIDNEQDFFDENSSDEDERIDEKPQVVVLKEGDLTAEEVAKFEKEEKEKPADLSQRVIFKSKNKNIADKNPSTSSSTTDKKQKKKDRKNNKNKLSFGDEDEDEEGDHY